MNPVDLLAKLAERLWPLAREAVGSLADPVGLQGLEPDPSAGAVLSPRLLGPIPAKAADAGLAGLVRSMLGELTDGQPVRLHGWERSPGAVRGLALVASEGAARAVLAVSPDPPTVDVVLAATNRGDPVQLSVPPTQSGPWTLDVTATLPGDWEVTITPDAPPQVLQPAPADGSVSVRLQRGPFDIGPANGPGLAAQALIAAMDAKPAGPAPTVQIKLDALTARPIPTDLGKLLGLGSTDPISVTVLADRAGGVRFDGSGDATRKLPVRLNRPGLTTRDFGLSLGFEDAELRLGARLSLAAALPALPLRAQLDDVGFDIPFALGSDKPVTPGPVLPQPPSSIGVELALPPVSGGGVVRKDGNRYAGILDLNLAVLRVQAIGLLRLPDEDNDLSLLLLISAHFPPPGIQLSFGFALDAVGGLVGINHRADPEALRALVVEGNADRVLFPDDARGQAGAIIASLGAAFPVAPGRFVIGPMLRITWGGRIVSLSAAVLIELPDPVQLILLGRLLIALPDPAAPLIRLQASVFGRYDPAEPSVELLASLAGSWVVGVPISGEVLLLFRGGRNATFVLSAGGFHPRYARPAGVPALRRLSVDLSPGGAWGLRAEAYLAVTSNSVQFGGRIVLDATIAGCGVEGFLGLDALFIWDPTFRFSVRIAARVAVRAFGVRLASVGLDFTLEGPAPWHVFGTGSVSVLFWDASLDFDITWGERASLEAADVDVEQPLREALARRDSWALEKPVALRTPLVFTANTKAQLAAGTLLHPDAALRASQKVLPFNREVTRHNRVPLAAQTWVVESAQLGDSAPPLTGLASAEELFLPGQHFAMSEEEQLSRGAFEPHPSGVHLLAENAVDSDEPRPVDDRWETNYQPPPPPEEPLPPRLRLAGGPLRWLDHLARLSLPGERAWRWSTRAPLVTMTTMPRFAVQPDTMQPMAAGLALLAATPDASSPLAAQLGTARPDGAQFVEPWEIEL